MGERQWKEAVLADFKAWLAGLDDDVPPVDDGSSNAVEDVLAGPDLHALYSELASLRQEVRLQNREQARMRRQAEGERETQQEVVRRTAERACLQPMLEVRDALLRGQEAAAVVRARRWLRPRGIEAVAEGYTMALARFDRTLADLGATQVVTKGETFNVRTMVAVDVRRDGGATDGIVLRELRSGFVYADGGVLRAAEVVVNRL